LDTSPQVRVKACTGAFSIETAPLGSRGLAAKPEDEKKNKKKDVGKFPSLSEGAPGKGEYNTCRCSWVVLAKEGAPLQEQVVCSKGKQAGFLQKNRESV